MPTNKVETIIFFDNDANSSIHSAQWTADCKEKQAFCRIEITSYKIIDNLTNEIMTFICLKQTPASYALVTMNNER